MVTSVRPTAPLRAALLALIAVLTVAVLLPGIAEAKSHRKKAKTKVTLTASPVGQAAVLKARKLTLKAKPTASGKLRVSVAIVHGKKSLTLATTRTVKVKRGRTTKVTLTTTKAGRTALARCTAATVRLSARLTYGRKHVSTTRSLKVKLDSAACKKVTLPPVKGPIPAPPTPDPCDPIDPANCLFPFPSDFYTVPDASTGTGRRVDFPVAVMPRNKGGVPIDPTEWNRNDGFSPGSSIITRVPGLDNPAAVANSHLPPVTDIGTYADANAGVVVIDTATGERWPVWAEIDSNAVDDAHRTLIVRPAKNFLEGHRYVVGLRDLRNADNVPLAPNAAFQAYRDGTATDARAAHMNDVFATLSAAGIARESLYLAWDFTVASERGLSQRALAIRDDAFRQLGDDDLADQVVPTGSHAPAYAITSRCRPNDAGGTCPSEDVGRAASADFVANVAVQVKGTFTVPCYLTSANCAPGGRFTLDAAGNPTQHGTMQARFVCNVPASASAATKAFPALYGHGLFGDYDEAGGAKDVWKLGNDHKVIVCAADWIGMADEDVLTAGGALTNLSTFPGLVDRLQQGFVDFMYLGRLLHTTAAQGGLAQDATFQDGGQPLIDTSQVAYYGNSQGGIMGGALTALSPDITRSALYVGAMNYSTLLPRSVDFDDFKPFLFGQAGGYPDSMMHPLALALMQMLWDRGEPNGYAQHMTTDPLPNTPPHHVLLEMALGDHQVSNVAFLVEARTIGARIRTNQTIAPERLAEAHAPNLLWGVPTVASQDLPITDSAMNVWDIGPLRPDPGNPGAQTGVPMPPMTNQAPGKAGQDPHDYVIRNSPAIRRQIADWMRAGGQFAEQPRTAGDGCGVGQFCKLPDAIWDGTFPG